VALVQTVSEKTFALIKPDALVKMGKIIETIETQFRITKMRMVRLSVQQAREFVAMNEQYSQQHAEVRMPMALQQRPATHCYTVNTHGSAAHAVLG